MFLTYEKKNSNEVLGINNNPLIDHDISNVALLLANTKSLNAWVSLTHSVLP